jgi:WD40 repeat protein
MGHTEGVTAVAAAYVDGRPLVISGGRDHTVRVWNLATGRPAGRPLVGHAQAVTAVAVISLDGRPAIVSGSADCMLRVWDLATGALIGEPLSGHTASVTAIAATDLDGTPVVASGGEDARVLLWYPARRNRLTRLRLWPGPRSPLVIGRTFPCDDQVSALAICSASQRIAVGCGTSLDFHSFDGRHTQRIEPMARILEIAFGDYPNVVLGVDRGMVQLRLNDNRIGGTWLVT